MTWLRLTKRLFSLSLLFLSDFTNAQRRDKPKSLRAKLDPSKDQLVEKIVSEQFKGEIVRVVGRENYHGLVGNTLLQNSPNGNLVHRDTLAHGERYISPILDQKEATVISLGTTLQELAGGGRRLVEECLKIEKTDIIFIVDESWSVRPEGFEEVKSFLLKLANNFDVGPTNTQFSTIQYNGRPRNSFHFKDIGNRQDLKRHIKRMTYRGGNTATGAAITLAHQEFKSSRFGARPNSKKVAIVITDGESLQDKVGPPSKKMKEDGVEIFTIGIGDDVNHQELEEMASEPKKEHVFHVDNFDTIVNIEKEILRDVCAVTCKY